MQDKVSLLKKIFSYETYCIFKYLQYLCKVKKFRT